MIEDVKPTRRGFVERDAVEFGGEALTLLREAQCDMRYLLDRGYHDQSAAEFVGNHFQLSARQRTALLRASCSAAQAAARKSRLLDSAAIAGAEVHIDAFNLVITLEAALSLETTLLLCADGAIRDLCGLHGTYRVIADTKKALSLFAVFLREKGAAHASFYLDAPVSNSGRLKSLIETVAREEGLSAHAALFPNPDVILAGKDNVISSDSVVIDRARTWLNITEEIIRTALPGRRLVSFQ